MNNEDKILEMLAAIQVKMDSMQNDISSMQGDIQQLNARMDSLETKVDNLVEAHAETHDSVNAILDWTDKVSSAVNFPLPRI